MLLIFLSCMESYEATDSMMTGMVFLVLFWWVLQTCGMSVAAVSTRPEETPYVNKQQERLFYNKDTLLALAKSSIVETITVIVPDVVKRNVLHQKEKGRNGKKRGRRGGVRVRCRRRGARLPLPMCVTGNVRSIRNKIDELSALCKWNYAYREASIICLTETWLNGDIDPDSAFQIDGYQLIRSDRTPDSGKSAGGGVCAYVNNRWCKDITVIEKVCNDCIEYMTLSVRPYYLPREFNKIFIIVVYIPPNVNIKNAESLLYDAVCKIENASPEAVKLITGDFNGSKFKSYVPHYHQYIDFATREEKILDYYFCNIRSSYKASKLKPLGLSDHAMCLLSPVYRQKLKTCKPVIKEIYEWDDKVSDTLRGCMEMTEWDVLYDENVSIDENVDVLNCYLSFCVENILPVKSVKCYPNNKPWFTKDLKKLLHEKRLCGVRNDRVNLKIIQKKVDDMISVEKEKYKRKMENWFKNDTKAAWQGLRTITGMTKKSVTPDIINIKDYCNELNKFYCRFDVQDYSVEQNSLTELLCNKEHEKFTVTHEDVLESLKRVKSNKASGPDRVSAKVINICKYELVPVLCRIFQSSLDQSYIPKLWKTSEIIPVPKHQTPKGYNDYRPVALTCIFMKCLERVVKKFLLFEVKDQMDVYQFAYKKDRCVEDATLSIINYILKFLENVNNKSSKHFAKVLFVDFSSAFNTIQPHVLMEKLIGLNVSPLLVLWIREFLVGRVQCVKLKEQISDLTVTNTGAPQGCVLSPLLFSLYTNDCRSRNDCNKIFKYADDTAIVSLCVNNDVRYRQEVNSFSTWCKENFLELNVNKTKEMIIDFGKTAVRHEPLVINDGNVERVEEYKYLGTIIDNKFNFSSHIDSIYKKTNSRMFFVRKLCKLNVSSKIMDLFYCSILQSVFSFAIGCWYGNSTLESKSKISKIIKKCSRLNVKNTKPLLEIYKRAVTQRSNVIINDPSHPLHSCYEMLPSGRRWRSVQGRTSRYRESYIPSSIRVLNSI